MPDQIDLNTKYAPSDKVVPRRIKDKIIIVPIEDGVADFSDAMFSLNETGELIWAGIEKNQTLEEIITNLTEEYNADTERIEQGVIKLITTLLEKGIITPCPG